MGVRAVVDANVAQVYPATVPQDLVPYLGNRLLPRSFEATVKDPDLPYDLTLRVRVEDGVPRIVELVCADRKNGEGIDGRGLRALPMTQLLAEACAERERVSDRKRDRPVTEGSTYQRQPMTDELLEQVAQVYRSAEPLGRPVEAVAEYFSTETRWVPRNTVRRWVMEARKRGFLEPSQQGESRRANAVKATKKASKSR